MASTFSTRIARTQPFTSKRSFLGQSVKVNRLVKTAPARQSLTTVAIFGGLFGGGKAASSAATTPYYICIDCGYVYDNSGGEFKGLPSSYKCPKCNSPKNRFKLFKGEVKGKPNNTGSAMQQRMKEKKW